MRKSILLVLLAAAVVLAGCSGLAFGGDGTPTRTVTPAAVPTDEPTPTPVPQLAPGLTGQGVTDTFALGEAHVAALDDISYAMHRNHTVTYANGTVYNHRTVDVQIAANDSRYYVARNASGSLFGGGSFGRAIWSSGERAIVAETTDNTTSYSSPRTVEGSPVSPREALRIDPTNRQQIYAHFSAVETRVTGREARNGTTLYRVEATGVTNPVAFEGQWRNPQNLTLIVHIDSAGLVGEYRLNYTATVDGSPVRVNRRARYTDLGNTTVERPPWYDAAITNVSTATTAG